MSASNPVRQSQAQRGLVPGDAPSPWPRLRQVAVGVCAACLWPLTQAADAPTEVAPASATANYSIGYQLGADLATLNRLGIDTHLEAVLRGLSDALAGATPPVSPAEMAQMLAGLRDRAAAQGRLGAKTYEGYTTRAFNALNADLEGVVTLPSGLQYKVQRPGTGRQPQAADSVTIHYQAALPNGVVLDSTYEDGEPATLRLADIATQGLRQAILLMTEGAQWELYVPAALGFREQSNLGDRPVIYRVELLEVIPAGGGDTPAEPTAAPGETAPSPAASGAAGAPH
jgi:FKBP-type peptidyl-prolyl cis-trans isomerase FklB